MQNNQKDMGKNNNDFRAIFVLLTLVILILAGLYLYGKNEGNTDAPVLSNEESTVPNTEIPQEESETTQETSSEEESILYPEPEYEFTTEEVTIAIEGLSKEYTLAWVSDLHLISDHESGELLGDVHVEYLDAIHQRYEELAITEDGVHAEDLWPEIVKYLNYNAFDGVIFGGDIMDYCSNSNIALIKEGLDNLHIPYIYIRADHDYGAYYGGIFFTETEARTLHQTIDEDQISNKFWDRNDFIVLGIDHSTKDMPEYYLNMVKDVYSRGKPVIMVTHVPYESRMDDSLAELSMQERGKIYYWSQESKQFQPNVITQQYLELIYDKETIVEQVLAGHLHASWDGKLSEQVSQHIFSPAFRGTIGIIHIVPK